ncbi:MAG: AsmA-like C-terminal region-containing protein [Flavobacteriales bacterium]
MGKWIKRLFITLGILIVLLLAAAILIPVLFKDKIEAAVKKQVNESINATVDWGDWDLSIIRSFPNASISVENVKVCNVAPFDSLCLADIGELRATIGLMSLFSDRIQIKNVALTRPYLHFKVLKDGTANWDIAKPDSTSAELPADTSATTFNVALKEYSITRGRIIYDDESLPMLLDLAGVDHTGSGDFAQDLFVLRTKTTVDTTNVVFDGVKYLKNAKADIKADLDMDLPNMKFTFKENEAVVNQLALGFDGWLAMPTNDITMDLKWAMKKSDIGALLSLIPAEFAKDMKGVDMTGKAAFNGYVKGLYNDTHMPGFGVTINVDNGRFKYPDLPASVDAIYVDCNIQSPEGKDMDGMVVDLKRFALKMAGNPVEARMHLTTPISDPNVDAALKADLDLASVKKVVPLPKGDDLKGQVKADVTMAGRMSSVEKGQYDKFKAAGQLALRGMDYKSDSLPYGVGIQELIFDFSPKFLALTNFIGNVGKSDIAANGRLDNYLQWWLKDSTLAGSFNVNSNTFDLNELMGPSGGTASAEATTAKTDTAAMSLIEVPKNVNFTLNAAVKQVLYDKLALTNTKGTLHVHDERVDLRDVFFNLFEGSVGMKGSYDTKDKKHPLFDLAYDVKDLDIAQTVGYVETVQKMAPIAKACRGRFSTAMTMKAELDQHMSPVMNTLSGEGTLKTKSVTIEGFKPMVELSNVLKMPKLASAKLEDVNFSYEFREGKMITKPFDVKIDRLKANVGGSTAFADQAIDYNVKAKVPSDMFGVGATQLASSLLGQLNSAVGSNAQLPAELDLTAKITGTVEKPVVKPVFGNGGSNLKDAALEEGKAKLNEEIGKAKEDVLAKAMAERDRLVAEAQQQADKLKADARKQAADIKAQAYKAADDELAKVTNPLAKAAAKVVADKAKQAADKKEQDAIAETDKRADGLVDAARKQGDALVDKAKNTDTTIK